MGYVLFGSRAASLFGIFIIVSIGDSASWYGMKEGIIKTYGYRALPKPYQPHPRDLGILSCVPFQL
jgi:hypothetical protein